MGCDIHIKAEVLVVHNGRKKWATVTDPIVLCWCYRKEDGSRSGYGGHCGLCTCRTWFSGMGGDRPYLNRPGFIYNSWCQVRDYTIFSVLADVRNDGGIKPISEPRGIPTEIGKGNRMWMERGDHSQTWVTLDEVLNYPWYYPGKGSYCENFLKGMLYLQELTGGAPTRLIMWFDG